MAVASLGLLLALAADVATATTARPLTPPLQLALPPPRTAGPRAALDLRLSLGAEWDTNAPRAVSGIALALPGASLPGEVAGDGVTRLVTDLGASFRLAEGHGLELRYVLGAKRFFERTTEDLLVHDLSASSAHVLLDALTAQLWGTLRASRIRSGARDYSLGATGLSIDLRPVDVLVLSAHGSIQSFRFEPEDRLSFLGPSLGARAAYQPIRRLSLDARFDLTWRAYDGNALVPGTMTDPSGATITVVTFCDQVDDLLAPPACEPKARRDREVTVTLRAAYRGAVVIGGEYLARIQRSTSELESIDRHRASAFATFPLPFELTGNIAAALQVSNGVSVTDTKYLAEDDENQNSVQLQLSRVITGGLSAEVRYALFANQFTTAEVDFLRQTIYAGISYRIRSGDDPAR